jgi:hypothetical protein
MGLVIDQLEPLNGSRHHRPVGVFGGHSLAGSEEPDRGTAAIMTEITITLMRPRTGMGSFRSTVLPSAENSPEAL